LTHTRRAQKYPNREPVSDTGFTSKNRAQRFVTNGLVTWSEHGVSIRFLRDPRDHRDRSALKQAAATRCGYDRTSNCGMATLTELANLPMIAPAVVLGLGKRKGASRHTFVASQGL
jgi:hypothetical protein